MTSKTKTNGLDRRGFLRGIGGASTAAVAAVAGSVAGTGEATAYAPGTEESKARYRESDHVKAFYRTNGYETLKK